MNHLKQVVGILSILSLILILRLRLVYDIQVVAQEVNSLAFVIHLT